MSRVKTVIHRPTLNSRRRLRPVTTWAGTNLPYASDDAIKSQADFETTVRKGFARAIDDGTNYIDKSHLISTIENLGASSRAREIISSGQSATGPKVRVTFSIGYNLPSTRG